MSAEDHLGGRVTRGGNRCQRVVDALCNQLQETGRVVPGVNFDELHAVAERLTGATHVLRGRHRRRVRSEDNADDFLECFVTEAGRRLFEQWWLELRAKAHVVLTGVSFVEDLRDARHLRRGALRERRDAANGEVSTGEVGQ